MSDNDEQGPSPAAQQESPKLAWVFEYAITSEPVRLTMTTLNDIIGHDLVDELCTTVHNGKMLGYIHLAKRVRSRKIAKMFRELQTADVSYHGFAGRQNSHVLAAGNPTIKILMAHETAANPAFRRSCKLVSGRKEFAFWGKVQRAMAPPKTAAAPKKRKRESVLEQNKKLKAENETLKAEIEALKAEQPPLDHWKERAIAAEHAYTVLKEKCKEHGATI
jgi:hypothetical protein